MTEAAVDIIDVAACTFVVIAGSDEPYESDIAAGTLQLAAMDDGGKLIIVFRSMGDVTVELSDGDECEYR